MRSGGSSNFHMPNFVQYPSLNPCKHRIDRIMLAPLRRSRTELSSPRSIGIPQGPQLPEKTVTANAFGPLPSKTHGAVVGDTLLIKEPS